MRRYLTSFNRLAMSFALCLLLAPELLLAQGRTYVPPQFTTGSGGSIVAPGPILLPNGSASNTSLRFSGGAANYGWYSPDGTTWDLSSGGTVVLRFGGISFNLLNNASTLNWGSSADVTLARDAANTLALRNGTAAQTFNIYNTYTDASNYERLAIRATGGEYQITPQAAGTGTARLLRLTSGGGYLLVNADVTGGADDSYNLGTAAGLNYFWATAYLRRSIQGSKSKALTEGAPTSFVRVSVPQTALSNYGGGSVGYTVYATNGTDSQSLVGDVRFAMLNKAGTEVCTIGEIGTAVLAESAGGSTLTCTWTCATAAADTVDLSANCTSSLAQTTFTIEHRGDMQKTNTWTPQ